MLPADPLPAQSDSWLQLVDQLNIKAFVNLTLSDSVRRGTQQLLFISGLGEELSWVGHCCAWMGAGRGRGSCRLPAWLDSSKVAAAAHITPALLVFVGCCFGKEKKRGEVIAQ